MNAALHLVSPSPQTPAREPNLGSGFHDVLRPDANGDDPLTRLQDLFIENWARMAGAFAMDRTMGRVHALTYISIEPLSAERISQRLALPAEVVESHIETLVSYGLVTNVDDGYTAEQDGWTWFLRTLRERRQREFVPIQQAVNSACELANEMARSGDTSSESFRATAARIQRFTKFFGELSNLLDTLVTLGAGPMIKVLKTFARLMPRARTA